MKALRLDIQALRGLAVLLVLAFHAGLPGLSAGYLGVDLFFVISGFLITGLIKAAIENGDFSFANFYYRRARRLLPAAYTVLAAVALFAPFILTAIEIDDLRDQVIGSVGFVANFVLWQQTGYFDGAADTKPLLHFWSLAVEEQYYFVMPLLLLITPRKAWAKVAAIITIVSFGVTLYTAVRYPDFAFYLPFTRMWELGIGSLGALAGHHIAGRSLLSKARVPALVILFFVPFFPTGMPHPGLDALLVCVSTLVIILGRNENRLEGSPPVRFFARVGNISYSLYLVHWPIIVYTRIAWSENPPLYAVVFAVALSFVSAFVLYTCVEEPFRHGNHPRPRRVISVLAFCAALLVVSPFAFQALQGQPRDFAFIRRPNHGLNRACGFGTKYEFRGQMPTKCQTKPHAKVLVWGDSYAMVWSSALAKPLAKEGMEQATMGGCDPLYGMARFPKIADRLYNRAFAVKCLQFAKDVLNYVASNPDLEVVVIGGRFQTILSSSNVMLVHEKGGTVERDPSVELAAQGLAALANNIRAAGKRVVIMAPPPSDGRNIGDCLERRERGLLRFGDKEDCDIRVKDHLLERGETLRMLSLASKLSNTPVVDVFDYLCNQQRCKTQVTGTILYRDYGHLTVEGAQLIGVRARLGKKVMAAAR